MFIIKGKVTSNSIDNDMCMVSVNTFGLLSSTYTIPAVNGIPLVQDDIVWLLIDDNGTNPIILGKSFEVGDGKSVLFRSGSADAEVKAVVSDKDFNLTVGQSTVNIDNDVISLDGGSESMVLGDSLQKLLSDLIDTIMQITVTASGSASSTPINAVAFMSLKSRLQNILSKKAKLS